MVQFQSYAAHLSVLLSVVSGGVLIALVITKPGQRNPDVRDTTCKGLRYQKVGMRKPQCQGDDRGRAGDDNNKSYPCYKVDVQYYVEELKDFENSTLHEDEESVKNTTGCSAKPRCSVDADSNNKTLKKFIDDYGKKDKRYPCHYHHSNRKQVFLHSRSNRAAAVLAILIPAVFLGIGGILTAIYCKKMCLDSQGTDVSNSEEPVDVGVQKIELSEKIDIAVTSVLDSPNGPPLYNPPPPSVNIPAYVESSDPSTPPPAYSNPLVNKQSSKKSLRRSNEQISRSRPSLHETEENNSAE